MIAYKLVRELKSGALAPLFINKKLRYAFGEWLTAEPHKTKGFAFRPGFHCTLKPEAPHLSTKDRVWIQVEIEDYVFFDRPESQGGRWALAQKIKPLKKV